MKLAFVFWVPVQLPPPSLSSSPMVHGWLLSVWGGFFFLCCFLCPISLPACSKETAPTPGCKCSGTVCWNRGRSRRVFGSCWGWGGALVLSPGFAASFGAQRSPGGSGAVPPGRTRAGCPQVSPGVPWRAQPPFSSAFSIGSHLGADRAPAPAIQAAEPGPADDPVRRPPPCCRETPTHTFRLPWGGVPGRAILPSRPRKAAALQTRRKGW